jgi:hypothetical protein
MNIQAEWTGYGEGYGEVIGQESWAYSGDKDPGDNLPAEDIIEPVWLYPPFFYAHEAPANPLDCPLTRWGDPNWPVDLEMSLDITGWTRANWRDLRGAHSFTVADDDGIERTWEWEIF